MVVDDGRHLAAYIFSVVLLTKIADRFDARPSCVCVIHRRAVDSSPSVMPDGGHPSYSNRYYTLLSTFNATKSSWSRGMILL
jgi:hypothetical protein